MEEQLEEELRTAYEPLEDIDSLKAVLACGSDETEIIVLIEDGNQSEKIEERLANIEDERKEKVLTVKEWFHKLIETDPETLTCARTSEPVIDPEGFHETVKEIVREVEPDSSSKKAGELYGDGDEELQQAGDILKRQMVEQTIEEVYRAGNAYLRFSSRPAASPRQIASRLENELDEDMDFYRELLSAKKGGLKAEEFDISKLENDRDRALEVIDDMMFRFRNEVEKEQQRLRKEASDTIKSIYTSALEGSEEENISEKFVQEFMQEEPLAKHAKTVRRSVEKDKQLDEPLRELAEFIQAIYDNTEIDINLSSSIEPLIEYRRRVNDRVDPSGMFLLSVKDFLVGNSVSIVVLHKDDEIPEAEEVAEEIQDEYGFDIHVRTETLRDYWGEIYQRSSVAVQELDYASVMHDPDDLIGSMKSLERGGEFRSSPGWMREQFRSDPLKIIQPEEKTKLDVLKNLHEASITFGHAILIHHGITPSKANNVPGDLRAQVGEKIGEEHIETIDLATEMYRDLEYDERDDITASDLEDLYKEVKELKQKTADIINVV